MPGRSFPLSLLALAATSSLLAACTTGPAEDPPLAALEWSACGARVEGGLPGECARAKVPARWSLPRGRSIEVVVKRLTTPGAHGQLWILDGGPGSTGTFFESPSFVDPIRAAGWDVYIPSHRGTGESTPLECATQQDPQSPAGRDLSSEETLPCVKSLEATWGDDLAGFSAADAAKDVGSWIERARVPGQAVAVYGASYGTYLAQRYLQAFPDQASAVVMDGVVPLDTDLSTQLLAAEPVGERFFALCAEDEVCRARLGPQPREAFEQALQALDTGACAGAVDAGITGNGLRAIARTLIDDLVLGVDGRAMLTGLIYRVRRCDASDVMAFNQLGAALSFLAQAASDEASDPAEENPVLGYQIVASSLWSEAPLDLQAYSAAHASALLSSADEALPRARILEAWPREPRAPNATRPAQTSTPLLFLNGDLDTFSPMEWAERAAAQYPGSHLVRFSTAGHGTILSSPLANGDQCAVRALLEFIDAPTAPPATGCVEDVLPLDFAAKSEQARELAQALFGTTDLYGDP